MPTSPDAVVALQLSAEEFAMGMLSKAMGMAAGRRGTAAAPAKAKGRRGRPAAGGGKGRMAGKAFKALRGRGKI